MEIYLETYIQTKKELMNCEWWEIFKKQRLVEICKEQLSLIRVWISNKVDDEAKKIILIKEKHV